MTKNFLVVVFGDHRVYAALAITTVRNNILELFFQHSKIFLFVCVKLNVENITLCVLWYMVLLYSFLSPEMGLTKAGPRRIEPKTIRFRKVAP